MAKAISFLLAAASVTSVFWFHAAPNGEALCASDTPFRTQLDNEPNQVAAASTAKMKFCKVVSSFPI